uniref:Uncharacterized protein n=1 Tax=Manihot esculenta TaxID=3983 RepID=A0A2C9VLY9_MANES
MDTYSLLYLHEYNHWFQNPSVLPLRNAEVLLASKLIDKFL